MTKKIRYTLISLGLMAVLAGAAVYWINQATATRHSAAASPLGQISSRDALVDSLVSGTKISLRTVEAADWSVPLSGLLNLNHPKAKQAAIKDKEESIQVFAYHLQHPKHGDFLVDTGISKRLVEHSEEYGVSWLMRPQLGFDRISLLTSTESFMENLNTPLQGVFLTHLHLDHISGLPAIDKQVPLYLGQGESAERFFMFAATRGIVDAVLEGRPTLREWSAPYVDIFGDGSVFAIHSPGHTAGSTAYLVNTHDGPVLLAGDASHTSWGWKNGVEPGKFSTNQPRSRESLMRLIKLVEDYPEIEVKLGHQKL